MQFVLYITDTEISEMPFCSTFSCFSTADKSKLRKKMRIIISASNRTRRAFIGSFYGADHGGKFKYDGQFVCSNFLLDSLRFSRDLQESVKKGMAQGKAEEAQIATLRSSSQERTQQDPVTMQTVQAPDLNSSSDAVVKRDIHYTVRSCQSHSRSGLGSHLP